MACLTPMGDGASSERGSGLACTAAAATAAVYLAILYRLMRLLRQYSSIF